MRLNNLCKYVTRSYLDAIAGAPVVVFGDVVLDRYIHGSVARISREAPVPVVRAERTESNLGGTGNVVANLRGLGVPVTVLCRLGTEHDGDEAMAMLLAAGADCRHVIRRGGTVVKTRVMGPRGQQMLRIDTEDVQTPSPDEESRLYAAAEEAIRRGASCFVISDYGCGMVHAPLCRRIINLCNEKRVITVIDPRGTDWSKYSGAAIITPNLDELGAACGRPVPSDDGAVLAAAREMAEKYGIKNVVVTRSEKGITLVSASEVHHCPAMPVQVYDVSGAGDTVVAAIAAFHAAGVPLDECIKIANCAAQAAVTRLGTYPVKLADIACLQTDKGDKTASWEQASIVCENLKKQGKRVVFTNGCFDVLHSGHLESLRAAAALGDVLIVGLNSDASISRIKGPNRPVYSADARAKMLSALEWVDMVVIFEEDTPERLLYTLRPDVLAKGGDYRAQDLPGREYVGHVHILPYHQGYSSTSIIEKIQNNK